MAFILNIETSTKKCSVSISKNGKVIALQELNQENYSHSEKLHLFIQKVIEDAGISISDLSAIAVSKGPGSYTGLRIGVSTAKGLCFALEIPLISVSTLQALALQVQEEKGVIIPLLDARRMEVYSAVFSVENQQVREIKAEVIDENSFEEYLENQQVYFLGDGANKCKEIILHSNTNFIDDALPSAKEMAVLSYQKWQQKDFEDVAYFEPFYLKDFVVTRSKKK